MTPTDSAASAADRVVVLSATSESRLLGYAARLRAYLDEPVGPRPALRDIAYTLQVGRVALACRLAVIAADVRALRDALDAFLSGRPHPGVRVGTHGPAGRPGSAPDLDAPDPGTAGNLGAAVDAWLAGREVAWRRYWSEPAARVALPTQPWDGAAPTPLVEPTPVAPASVAPAPSAQAIEGAERYLVRLYAQASGIPAAQLDPHLPLDQLGISSFVVSRVNALLAEEIGETDRTLFFAHRDLAGVAAALVARHPGRWAGDTTAGATAAAAASAAPAPPGAYGAVAVIGIAGRYPQAANVEEFWTVLSEGRDCVRQLPAGRARDGWPVDLMWGGFLDEVDGFDPLLFNISPRDADLMDPQERLFLEVVWEALEDAGYTRDRLRERHRSQVAVYAGAMHNEYPYFGVERSRSGQPQDSGATLGGIANRVSFFLDLHGLSLSVDTMCSSSLTAIHLALRALRSGEAEIAIAGAVNLSLHPNKFVQQHRMRLNASDHRCHSFGAGGDGFVPAEGAGAVILKPLDRALADGDRVHAVIRGSAVVHAGRTNGYLVPNPVAQGEMVARALRDAGVDPATIGYLEAHGAGTALGDPVEIEGLLRAFGEAGLPVGAVPIGSVKSTIGHVESAAGIAGLTKVILQKRHGALAPSLHAEELNPNIAWDTIPFRVQRELAPWVAAGAPRRAGISSFGAGGTIAHVVLEEFVAPPARPATADRPELVVLSAYDEERLVEVCRRLLAFLSGPTTPAAPDRPALADIAYTLQVGREPLRERLAVVVGTVAELRDRLASYIQYRPSAGGSRGILF